jgi:hypothetical protein
VIKLFGLPEFINNSAKLSPSRDVKSQERELYTQIRGQGFSLNSQEIGDIQGELKRTLSALIALSYRRSSKTEIARIVYDVQTVTPAVSKAQAKAMVDHFNKLEKLFWKHLHQSRRPKTYFINRLGGGRAERQYQLLAIEIQSLINQSIGSSVPTSENPRPVAKRRSTKQRSAKKRGK